MIYLFDRQKKLQKIIPRKHLLSGIQIVELNGLYTLSVEVPLFYETKEGTQYNHKKNVEKAWFAGHYDRKNRFQLYKIHTRKVRADNKRILLFDGVHIFFDEAKAMGNIHDRRFRDSEMKPAADAAFNPIGWYVKDYDVTDRADINFYRDSVANARSLIIEKFGVEFDYGLTFDGRKIISKDLYIKKRLGRWTGKRFAYGTNLLSLTQEQDESEVYTAAVGRGRGEESGEGHGPRLEFGDIEWEKDGIKKPIGQNWIEIPSATQAYGYYENGEIKPRIMNELVFENTENKKLLADSTYYWVLENSVPKAVWETNIAKSDVHDLGDGVAVIYKKADIIKSARVHKMENNLLDDRLSKVIIGDYGYFKQDRQQQNIKAQIKRNHTDNQSVITQMKHDFDARMDEKTKAIENAYKQAVIDSRAEIQASEVRMRTRISEQRTALEKTIESEKENAIETAKANAEDIEERITETIDTTRTQLETKIANAEADAIKAAVANAEAIEERINTEIGTQREQLEAVISTAESDAIEAAATNAGVIEERIISAISEQRTDLETAISTAKTDAVGTATQNAQNIADTLMDDPDTQESVKALSIQAVEADIARVRTAFLDADVINGDHIEATSIVSKHLALEAATMERLVARTIFTDAVTTKSLEAVEGEFASLFASQVEANVINVDHISGRSAWFTSQYILNANIERLTAQNVFTNAITTKSLDAIEANIGRVQTAVLTADVIDASHIKTNSVNVNHLTGADAILEYLMARTIFSDTVTTKSLEAIEANIGRVRTAFLDAGVINGDYIQANTIEAKHLTGMDAILDLLMARTIFSEEVTSVSIDAIYADLRSVNSEIMTSNIIKSNWLNVDTALFNRFTANEAFIDRLVVKAANIRDIEAVTIDAIEANLTTVMNKMGEVEGGLSIRRPDGAYYVEQGIQKFGQPIQLVEYRDLGVEWNGQTYQTSLRGSQIFMTAYTDHSGRYANFSFRVGMRWDSPSLSDHIAVVVRPSNVPSGVSLSSYYEERAIVHRDRGRVNLSVNVPLPRPTYGALSFQLEFYNVASISSNSIVEVRPTRAWISF